MTFTVEKIGGTSMTAFDAVLDNILLRPQNPYNRIFVVSAYGGMTDALLECKKPVSQVSISLSLNEMKLGKTHSPMLKAVCC